MTFIDLDLFKGSAPQIDQEKCLLKYNNIKFYLLYFNDKIIRSRIIFSMTQNQLAKKGFKDLPHPQNIRKCEMLLILLRFCHES